MTSAGGPQRQQPGGPDDAFAEALLVGAVERASPSGQERGVVRYLRDAVAPWAELAEIDAADNLAARFGTGPRRVMLLGHVDTAPGAWPVGLQGRRLHGRGAVDAKGSLCAMLVAASRLSAAQRQRVSVQVVGAVEEEATSSRGARHALQAYAAPELVVIGEPSGWDAITLGYKGRLALRVRFERPEGHSAHADASASVQLSAAWEQLRRWAVSRSARSSSAFDAVQPTLLEVRSGSDGLRQWAEGVIAFRLPPDLSPEQARQAVDRVVRSVPLTASADVQVLSGEAAHRSARDGPVQRALRSAIRAEGGTPRHLVKTGTSDMNVVAPVWRVPIVAYGPGDAALDHTPDEALDLDEYLRAARVLQRALSTLAGDAAAALAQTPERS